jgi:hypothetical protein
MINKNDNTLHEKLRGEDEETRCILPVSYTRSWQKKANTPKHQQFKEEVHLASLSSSVTLRVSLEWRATFPSVQGQPSDFTPRTTNA